MTEWVQPEHREIHNWLMQWGGYLRTHLQYGHCGSAEWRWRSPQCWDERNPRPPEPDLTKALLVEELMRIVPRSSRKLLKFKYVLRADEGWIRKKIRVRDYNQALYTARQIILNLVRHKLFPTSYGRFHHLALDSALELVA